VPHQNSAHLQNEWLATCCCGQPSDKISAMFGSLRHFIGWILSALGSRKALILENLALRQQLLALHAKRPRRRLSISHKLFWILLRRLWSGWKAPLVLVTPRTVVEWHRAGFRLYWKWLSRARQVGGRKPVGKEIRALIVRMAAENPTWGAPRIHGELLKLGFHVSEPTVSRWLRQMPRTPDPGQRWLTFLRNHREAIAAMDFFTVPTLTFGVLYCFFSSATTGERFCATTWHEIRVPFGSCSRCGKHGHTRRRIDSYYSTAIRSLAATWYPRRGN